MKKIVLLFIVALLPAFILRAQDMGLFEKKQFVSSKGDTLRYRILLPKQYDPSRKYPLVVFLHGAGERGSDNEKQLTHGAKLFLDEKNREQFPCIVVFPQCPANDYWASVSIDRSKQPLLMDFNYTRPMRAPLVSVIELTNSLLNEKLVDKKHVYITGLSMGGMGTFEAVYHNPRLFAAALPICGGGDANSYNKNTARIPFWIFHGDADPVVGVAESRKMVDRLKSLKASPRYSEYPGVGHNSWDNAFAEPDYLGWMFSKKRRK
ncbi:prolyl oligopeptidase family serine peptidase [Flavihumibacter rivuli]|uniref:carboxylesterase family protein n=1 Tax=Flavihumibacter rivuli TaxID=2838156 RepID=UPI001BDF43C8|nr:prolyl oligopeptidase family serine peptidase [Flavihumibacter rivuli]ULQ57749.1 prolyl oligopeptidase family serine peptidase [Flavihumibacter rivuli]